MFFVVFDGFLSESYRVTAVVSYSIKKFSKFLIKLFEKHICSISVRKGNSQVAAIDIHPML